MVLTYDPKRNRLFVHLLTSPYRHLPLDFADKVAYAQFLHDGSEVKLGKNGLELPPNKKGGGQSPPYRDFPVCPKIKSKGGMF